MEDKGFLDHLIEPDQRSQEWRDNRAGRFTSSEIYKLMTAGKREMTEEELAARPKGSKAKLIEDPTILSDGAMTFVKAKVAEQITGTREVAVAPALDWGNEHEPKARERFMEITGMDVETTGFIEYSTFAGGSPDGIVKGQEVAIVEIKCPYYSYNHIENITDIINAENPTQALKELKPEYYWQLQANMVWVMHSLGLETCPKGFYISYDPRFAESGIDLKYAVIEPNIDDQQYLITKLVVANEKKEEIIKSLN